MLQRAARFVMFATLAACTTKTIYVHPGPNQQDFDTDSRQCQALSFGAKNPFDVNYETTVYNSCMQGKGWYIQQAPNE